MKLRLKVLGVTAVESSHDKQKAKDAKEELMKKSNKPFESHWSKGQIQRLNQLLDNGSVIAYVVTDAYGSLRMDGKKIHAFSGLVQNRRKEHYEATSQPHRHVGARLWMVAMRGNVRSTADAYSANIREFIGEVLPEEALFDPSVACRLGNHEILSGTDLPCANLAGTSIFCADWSGAKMSFANMMHTYISNAKLINASFPYANISSSDIYSTNCAGANLTGTDFSRTKLINVDFSNANLSHADFSHAILDNVNLEGANLKGARMYGTDLVYTKLDSDWFIGDDCIVG